MRISRSKIMNAIYSKKDITDAYFNDRYFSFVIDLVSREYLLSEEQLVETIFMICKMKKEAENNLDDYIKKIELAYGK